MINKARRLQTPIVCSRTSPTSLSVALAEAWNMTIVAYVRNKRMRIYTHPERVLAMQAIFEPELNLFIEPRVINRTLEVMDGAEDERYCYFNH